jgi:FkbM family methyltransferase
MEPFGMDVALRGLADRGYRPKVIYDVGAADGQWTALAFSIWPSARLVCFEPLSERLEALTRLQEAHPGQVDILPCGIGDQDTTLTLAVSAGLFESSFAYGAEASRAVQVRRLDSLLAEGKIPPPSFVKIDVQGFERRVLEGGGEAFRHAELVLMECQFLPFCPEMRTLDATIADMSARGFIPYEFVDFLRRPLDGAMGQCDLLFVRRQHALVSNLRW